jgi:hypothetical protein
MAAKVQPHTTTSYTHAQSRHKNVPELPLRAICVAPSGGGKTTLLVSLILDIYRLCWHRIFVFSPTALLDDHWKAVDKYAKEVLGQEEPCLYDEFDDQVIHAIIRRHHRITQMCKEQGLKKLYGALIIVDDFADNARVMRSSTSLAELFVRGRHAQLSCIASVQKYRVLNPILRVNATSLFVFRLRSKAELDALVEENSAHYGPKITEQIFLRATSEPYSFLWLNLSAKTAEDLFWMRFEARIIPRSSHA